MRRLLLFILLSDLWVQALPAAGKAEDHPLDGLSSEEHWIVYDVLRASGHADAGTRYASVLLREPPKPEVLAWKPGQPFRREAQVVALQADRVYDAVVDIAGRRLLSWKELHGVQPNLLASEEEAVIDLVKHDPDFLAGLKRRGITDLDTVECWGASPGYFGTPEEEGRRLVRATCAERHGVASALGRPIEGLIAVIDLRERKVLRVIDTGPIPLARGTAGYDAESVTPRRERPRPLVVEQPQGPGFTLTGHQVGWQNWSFQFRVDPRRGLVLSTVRYADGGRARSILYQGSLSEIFVPYMDPGEGWYYLTYLDLGEYAGLGLVSSLEPGLDCPGNAVYFDAVFADEHGVPRPRPRAACLFEREGGGVAWRHFDEGTGVTESRGQRDLVLRAILTAGNYDYILDWVFEPNGSLRAAVGATGVVAIKGVASRAPRIDPDGLLDPASADARYGRFVTENIVAVNHDHFFCYRLDLDVDGTANSFEADQLATRTFGSERPRKSVWVVEPRIARTERDAQLQMGMDAPALWRVINPGARGPLGTPASYEIHPDHTASSLLAPADLPSRRAGFLEHTLWVTPYHAEELYAAGDFPTQSRGGDGLPAWTAADRPIRNTDLVAWYTLGFHHVVRTEDWPVTPTTWHSFQIRPFDFFDHNPAIDLPKGH